jgi:hypothetical protein
LQRSQKSLFFIEANHKTRSPLVGFYQPGEKVLRETDGKSVTNFKKSIKSLRLFWNG